ncbi:hypothetical protein KFL_007890120 [Klebsormidium nitens]|uniref:MYND-type domain-containing protein n=1 Tax=Klebsormidium nitens TaxID=105231 RepID=A0A1Y1IKZ7_KLENI|nr:hypothetical protein KFL_007890120 [Klebsormidium nitens]|eukprot:GAQ91464.1 hypothetical protein KFL_007890120 [Klebsormidium nitens]
MLLSMDTSFKGTTLNSNYLMPISGAEYGFSTFPWDCDLSSGNCYSYALGFSHAQEQKAQPSDLAMAYPDLVRNFDLRDPGVDLQRGCPDLDNSILADGIAAARIQDGNLGTKRNREWTTTEKTDWKKAASPGWYKMCAVIGAEDFHFLRQDVLDVYELYSTQLHGYHEVASPIVQKYWFGGSLWQTQAGGQGFYKSNDTPYDILGRTRWAKMANPRGVVQRYLDRLKTALVRGGGWRNPQMFTDVLEIAHMLRCIKLSPRLARSYFCIYHASTQAYVMLPVEEAPHGSITKLKEDEAADLRDDFDKALKGVNSQLTHITLIQLDTGYQLQTLLYFRESCDRLMEEEKWADYVELPKLIAKRAKLMGLSASKGDITISIHVPSREPLVEECITLSNGKRPDDATLRVVLTKHGLPVTESAVEDLLARCIRSVVVKLTEGARGAASKNCQKCCKPQTIGSKRLICSRCMRASYYSKECQQADWKRHKQGCVMGSVAVVSPMAFARDKEEFEEAYNTKSVFGK